MRMIDADALEKKVEWDRRRKKISMFERDLLLHYLDYEMAPTIQPDAPRVLTLEEVLGNAQKIGFPCWVEEYVENIGRAVLVPAVVTSDDIYVQYTGNDCIEGAIYHWAYNKWLRCWTARPTDEQREAVKWE